MFPDYQLREYMRIAQSSAPPHRRQRNEWREEEVAVLRKEIELEPNMSVPSRKVCENILRQNSSTFRNRTKVDVQKKYRNMIKLCSAPPDQRRRNDWTEEEVAVLRREVELEPNMPVPSRKVCENILRQNSSTFRNRTKVDVQRKYRNMIKKLSL